MAWPDEEKPPTAQRTASMNQRLSNLTGIPSQALRGGKIGLEKEGLRVTPDGRISQRRHPLALGSALTHPNITTDFSEALLELITPPSATAHEALSNLADTETFVHRYLDDELIWPTSMPCRLDDEAEIPIACYGRSNDGITKHVYRRGLAHRYGRMMQTIAGVHFNFSFSEELWPLLQQGLGQTSNVTGFIADRYMSTLRNLQRYNWLLLYLLGASPAAHSSFPAAEDKLQRLDPETLYAPYATSLRMSDIGYTNRLPAGHPVFIDHNSLDTYTASLGRAVATPHPPYEAIGVQVDGDRRQLNSHLLQIENEYYTDVRPKQILHAGETPLSALRNRGIRYLELRALDINPFAPSGVTLEQLHFLELFFHFCLFSESPAQTRQQAEANRHNLNRTAYRGRQPHLMLQRDGEQVSLRTWALELFDAMQPIAERMDGNDGDHYLNALEQQRACLNRPELTPSARLLTRLREQRVSFTDFAREQASSHHRHFLGRQLLDVRRDYLEALSRQSLRQQQQREHEEMEQSVSDCQTLTQRLCNRSGPRRCASCCG
jgi:glutamate--cysteine ligase